MLITVHRCGTYSSVLICQLPTHAPHKFGMITQLKTLRIVDKIRLYLYLFFFFFMFCVDLLDVKQTNECSNDQQAYTSRLIQGAPKVSPYRIISNKSY